MADPADEVWGGGGAADEVWGSAPDPADDVWNTPGSAPGSDSGAFVGNHLDEPMSLLTRGTHALRGSLRDWADEHPFNSNARPTPEEEIENLKTYGPGVAALGISLALPPMAPWAAAATGVGLGIGSRGAVPLLKGEGMDAAWDEANPLNNKLATALDIGVPFAGKAIANAITARRMSDLPDFAKATSANADLPPIDELATFREIGDDVSRETVELTTGQTARAAVADPAAHLLRSQSQAARIGGESLAGWGELRRQIKNQAGSAIEDAFRGLSKADAEDVGALLRGEARPAAPHVHAAAARMKQLLSDIGDRAESVPGMMTRAEDTGDLVPFKKIGGDYFPRVKAAPDSKVKVANLLRRGSRTDRVAHQRVAEEQGAQYVTNAKDAIIRYTDHMADNIASAHYFGQPMPDNPWGEKAYQLWQQMIDDGDALSADIFKSRLDKILQPQKLSRAEQAAQGVAQKTAHVVLGQSALTSFPQIAASPMRFGFGNTLEGMMRYATDPDLRQLYKASGAMDPGVTHMAMEAGVGKNTLSARLMGGMERGLRGAGSAGAVPYAEKLIKSAQKAKPSAATLRKLKELRVPLEEARGGMTADLMRRIVQRASDTNQLQAHSLEHAGEIFDSPLARVPLQFMQYPIAQGRMATDAVVRPIASGLRHANPSEVGLGVGRLARWAPAVGGAAAAVEGAKTLLTGQDFEPERVLHRSLETAAGLPGSVAANVMRGQNPVKAMFSSPPAVGIATQAWDSAERIYDDEPARGATELLADMLAAYDKTGTASVLRPTIRGWMRAQE